MFSTEFFFLFNLFQFIAKKKTNKKRKEKILSPIRNGRWIIYLHFVYKYYGKTLTFFRLLAESDRRPRTKWNLPRSFNLFAPGINYSIGWKNQYYIIIYTRRLCNARDGNSRFILTWNYYTRSFTPKRRESVVEIAYRKSLFGKSTNMLHYLREINFVKSFLNFVVNSIYQKIN